MKHSTPEERFWSHVDRKQGGSACWPWTAARQPEGYGRTKLEGVLMGAHRAAWILVNGRIPPGMVICHKCDNPPCCNPAHLFVGTQSDNLKDASNKGRSGAWTHPEKWARGDQHWARRAPERLARGARNGANTKPDAHPRGERVGGAKLTATQAEAIFAAYRSSKISQQALADRYGVNRTTIGRVVRGEQWRHVTVPAHFAAADVPAEKSA